MRKKCHLTLLVLMAVITLLPLWAATAWAATVTGTVVGRAGDAKSMANITLEGPQKYQAMANSGGVFRVENVANGTYRVTVSQRNNVQRFNANIQGNANLHLEVGW